MVWTTRCNRYREYNYGCVRQTYFSRLIELHRKKYTLKSALWGENKITDISFMAKPSLMVMTFLPRVSCMIGRALYYVPWARARPVPSRRRYRLIILPGFSVIFSSLAPSSERLGGLRQSVTLVRESDSVSECWKDKNSNAWGKKRVKHSGIIDIEILLLG